MGGTRTSFHFIFDVSRSRSANLINGRASSSGLGEAKEVYSEKVTDEKSDSCNMKHAGCILGRGEKLWAVWCLLFADHSPRKRSKSAAICSS